MKLGVFLIFTISAAWSDMKSKEIPLYLYATASGMLFLLSFSDCRMDWGGQDLLGGFCMGTLLILLGKVTGGQIGAGDGLFFFVSGMVLTLRENLMVLCSALVLCSFYGFAAAVCCSEHAWVGAVLRNKKVAFLPFLVPGVLLLFVQEVLR